MIYVTGDIHGDPARLYDIKGDFTKEDCVIICGDAGLLWRNDSRERRRLARLERELPFTVLWVDGNHENFNAIARYPVTEWHGGKAQLLQPHLIHLMRGQIYRIQGKTFFTMGGAPSHDIQDGILDPNDPVFEDLYWQLRASGGMFRVRGVSWWPQEMPSQAEYQEAEANLDKAGWAVDYILTHEAPTSILPMLYRKAEPNDLSNFLERVSQRATFQHWWFGHHHTDAVITNQFTAIYEKVHRIL